MRFRRNITTDTCINYEGINSKEKKRRIRKRKDERKWGGGDCCLNYKSINSEPGREEESDKKLQEGAKEITEVITRWSLGSFFQVIDHCHANNWSDQKMMIGVIIATLIAEEIKKFWSEQSSTVKRLSSLSNLTGKGLFHRHNEIQVTMKKSTAFLVILRKRSMIGMMHLT